MRRAQQASSLVNVITIDGHHVEPPLLQGSPARAGVSAEFHRRVHFSKNAAEDLLQLRIVGDDQELHDLHQ